MGFEWDIFSEDSLLGFIAGEKKEEPDYDWGSAAEAERKKARRREAALAKKLPRLSDTFAKARAEKLKEGDIDSYIKLTLDWVKAIRKLKFRYGVYYVRESKLDYIWLDDVIKCAAQGASEQTIRELIKFTGWLYLKASKLLYNYLSSAACERTGKRHSAFLSEWSNAYAHSNLLSLAEVVKNSSCLTNEQKEGLLDQIITIFARDKSRGIKHVRSAILINRQEVCPQYPEFWNEEILPIAALGASSAMIIKILLACERLKLEAEAEKAYKVLRENHSESYEEDLKTARRKRKPKFFLYRSLKTVAGKTYLFEG